MDRFDFGWYSFIAGKPMPSDKLGAEGYIKAQEQHTRKRWLVKDRKRAIELLDA